MPATFIIMQEQVAED